jgi:hypothetical protein
MNVCDLFREVCHHWMCHIKLGNMNGFLTGKVHTFFLDIFNYEPLHLYSCIMLCCMVYVHHVYKLLTLFSTSYCKEEMFKRSYVTMVTIINPNHGLSLDFLLCLCISFHSFAVPSIVTCPDVEHHNISCS